MFTNNLTQKQSKFFNYLMDYGREQGQFPSYQTIIDDTWINSKNGVHQYMIALKEKRYLRQAEWGTYELHPSKRYLIDHPENPIPIKGIITAGALQEPVETDLGSLAIRNLFPSANNPFCARVDGTSMREVGIADGDLVILDEGELRDKDIGAILYDGQTTLKEIHIGSDHVVFQPKSPDHEPIVIQPDEFEEIRVIGRYIAHFHDGRVQYV